MADPAMYIIANSGLKMSPGKLAAQCAHAAVEAYRLTPADSNLLRLWYRSGHYKKLILEARDEAHMRNIFDYLEARDIKCVKIIDEGRTEVEPLVLTAIGCEIVDKSDPHYKGCFAEMPLYGSLVPKAWPYFPKETGPTFHMK